MELGRPNDSNDTNEEKEVDLADEASGPGKEFDLQDSGTGHIGRSGAAGKVQVPDGEGEQSDHEEQGGKVKRLSLRRTRSSTGM